MKNHRLLMVLAVFVLGVIFTGCAKLTYPGNQGGTVLSASAVESTKKVNPPPVEKKVDVKPAETRPPEVKPAPIAPPEIVLSPDPAIRIKRDAIGCILPLSGRFADAGNKVLDAILLSAEIFDSHVASPWKIIVVDSLGSAEGARGGVELLADKENVMAIIAVAGAAEAMDAALEAEKRQVPLILITSREGVTEGREYVFQHFLTPTQQIGALAKYALNQSNVAIFSILYPQDDYGEEMLRLFRSEVQKTGGKVDKAIGYSKTQTDFTEQISKLAGNKMGASDKVYATSQEAKARLSVNFEALFIPDSPPRVKMITSQLAFHDIKVKLLGTSLWHSADLLKKGGEYLEGAVFADSFFPGGFLPETNDFVDIYYSTYRREPENIEALGYDTMKIVLRILAGRQIKTRDEFVDALLDIERFWGATGSIYFGGNQVAQKNAFILKITNGKLEQVK